MRAIALLLSFLIFVSNVKAEQIPDGCYVAFNNPGFCYESPSGFYEWSAFGDKNNTNLKYGYAAGAIILRAKELDSTLNICNSDYNTLLAERNSIASQNSTCIADYNNLVTPYNKNLALIKKLRKACGSKCKKIK